MGLFKSVRKNFEAWPDGLLTGSLLLGAVIIVCIALQPGHKWVKALTLAYITLP